MNNAGESFLLRIEGVNLYQVLGDTNQVSVIRGASMALRNVIPTVGDWLADMAPTTQIQNGASVGLFRLQADAATAQRCRDDIAARLNEDALYRHFTFVVDVQAHQDFDKDREKAWAKNRFRQLRQPTVAIPHINPSNQPPPCGLDGLRPATLTETIGQKSVPVSESVSQRLRYGRKQKKRFYERETGQPIDREFTTDLGEIAEDRRYGSLNGKLAYLYFDGNGFGGIQERHCQGIKGHIEFDEYIQAQRRDFLRRFIGSILNDQGFLNDNKLRLEILLWGGDEILLVVPAWQGFRTLNAFYGAAAEWEFGERLTHAGGMVFCHHKAPIYRVRDLARRLADRVKDQAPSNRTRNLFDYLVLESIDYPTEPLGQFFKQRYGEDLAATRQPLKPVTKWRDFTKEFHQESLLALPKSQVYQIARLIRDQPQEFETQLARLRELAGPDLNKRVDDDLKVLFSDHAKPWHWLHLVELWDYLAPQPDNNTEGGDHA